MCVCDGYVCMYRERYACMYVCIHVSNIYRQFEVVLDDRSLSMSEIFRQRSIIKIDTLTHMYLYL